MSEPGPGAYPHTVLKEALDIVEKEDNIVGCHVILVPADAKGMWSSSCGLSLQTLLYGIITELTKIQMQMMEIESVKADCGDDCEQEYMQ